MESNEYLLERLATDLRLAGKAERTVEAYTGAVRRSMKVSGITCLAEVCEDDLRSYLVGLCEQKVARGTFSINLCGVKFFFQSFLGHSSARTTQVYTHLTREARASATNPVDRLMVRPEATRRS